MTKETYISERKKLCDDAQLLIDSGKIAEAEKKTIEIKQFDEIWEKEALTQANLNAINSNQQKIPLNIIESGGQKTMADIFDTSEYRNAFKDYVLNNKKIPSELMNTDENTKTTDVGTVIPTTVLNKIIEKMENSAVILPLITRTAYKGGLTIPTSSVKPTASWVSEGTGSDNQKKTTGSITFGYNKLRCSVSASLEVETMALSAFESSFVQSITDAMTKALETSIFNGTGSGQPKGILTETPITSQTVEIVEGTAPTYATICEMEAALPSAYENGSAWFMSKKTFMKFMSITDTNGQPIARINYGIAGKPERTLLGRDVYVTENVTSYSANVEADTVIAFIFRPADYILNTNLNMTIKTYEDNDTDDTVRKAVMLVDGKVVDNNSLVELVIKNS